MIIKLAPFKLAPVTYFKILVRLHLKKMWWIYAILFFMGLYLLYISDSASDSYLGIFVILYLPIVLIVYYFWATSSKNRILFIERTITVEGQKMKIEAEGMSSEMALNTVIRKEETKDYLLLFVAKAQFLYIPKKAFQDVQELESFKQLLSIK